MARPDGPFRIKMLLDVPEGWNLGAFVHDEMNDEIPDYVLAGPGAKGTLMNNGMFLKENDVKICNMIVDVEDAMNYVWDQQHARCSFDYVYFPMQENLDCVLKFKDFAKYLWTYKNVKYIYTPWGVDAEKYKDERLRRDLDVMCCLTAGDPRSDRGYFHRFRYRMIKHVKSMRNIVSRTDKLIFDQYRMLMKHSKIFLVDTAVEGGMTAKYVEAGLSGCLLMGEKPVGMDDIFIDEKTFIEINYDNLENDLEQNIRYFIEDDEWRADMVENMKEKMLEHFTLEVVVQQFEEAVLKDYVPRSEKNVWCIVHEYGGADLERDGQKLRICDECLTSIMLMQVGGYKQYIRASSQPNSENEGSPVDNPAPP
jgi:glycosyltransferase involved in cell wall biosynthesis